MSRSEDKDPAKVTKTDLKNFLIWVNELGMIPPTQARVLSGLKAFFKFLVLENKMEVDPSALLESPKMTRKLPETLNILEINSIIDAIDLS